MLLHFEIDQEVNNCRDCMFSWPQTETLETIHTDDGLFKYIKYSDYKCKLTNKFTFNTVNNIPEWCPCVKVDNDEESSLCNYYRQQDGRCRATRDCEWEGCNGDRSKCPHNKIKVL